MNSESNNILFLHISAIKPTCFCYFCCSLNSQLLSNPVNSSAPPVASILTGPDLLDGTSWLRIEAMTVVATPARAATEKSLWLNSRGILNDDVLKKGPMNRPTSTASSCSGSSSSSPSSSSSSSLQVQATTIRCTTGMVSLFHDS